ncbi:GTPase HflX [Methylophilaceae bacterium]|nr:GTPase HflX [Methylophilaceae bacterium]
MIEVFERPKNGENAILVSLNIDDIDHKENTIEFKLLASSAGFKIAELVESQRKFPDAKFFIGSGKLEELLQIKNSENIKTIIFNHELTPSQERNIEKATSMRVYDRTALILFIFSMRAKSHEGKMQVELAHLNHLSSRLTKGWSHLERQKGGIGVRGGPGEKQIELDRRMLGLRIKQLKIKLLKLEKQRANQRGARRRSKVFTIAIVGYTNAGKSTLFNRLTSENILAENKLFATLDTTSRKLFIEYGHDLVISDTVGFIKNLPTTLIEAFKSTLEEASDADLLLHIVDISNTNKSEQILQVEKILEEIGANNVQQILVLNQIDKIKLNAGYDRDEYGRINRVQLSAIKGDGIEFLKKAIVERSLSYINERNGDYA